MHKILIGYDGSDASRRALDRATEMFRDPAEIAVISVAPYLHGGPHSTGPYDPTDTPEQHEDEAAEARGILAGMGAQARVIVGHGDPATLICSVAERDGFDTIVIGSRTLHGVKRALLGSVSSHVATHAGCDVMIVK
jgi:nucleotide-binding universal stress UspA family protein